MTMSKIATLDPGINVRCGCCQFQCTTDSLEESADECPACGEPESWVSDCGTVPVNLGIASRACGEPERGNPVPPALFEESQLYWREERARIDHYDRYR